MYQKVGGKPLVGNFMMERDESIVIPSEKRQGMARVNREDSIVEDKQDDDKEANGI